MSQHKAQGTSLAALLLPVGFLGFWEYYRNGNADIRLGLLIALGLFVGAFLGGLLGTMAAFTIYAQSLRRFPYVGWVLYAVALIATQR